MAPVEPDAASLDPGRAAWLASGAETALEPELAICDPHHHLWAHQGDRYLMDELLADTGSGHNVVSTVFVECGQAYRIDGPEELRPVGETEFVVDALNGAGPAGRSLLKGIVAFADLRLGAAVEPVLEAHRAAGDGRFRGIRHAAAWDASSEIRNHRTDPVGDLIEQPAFQAGVRTLGRLGLTYDIWSYHSQLDAVVALAASAPGTTVIVDHLGGPLGVGPYTGQHDEVLDYCQQRLARLAELPNAVLKLGGIGMTIFGQRWHRRPQPPSSTEVAELWAPHVNWCIDRFGADRCMFESNFPPDRASFGYAVLWNAFKRMTADRPELERRALFHDTAAGVYSL